MHVTSQPDIRKKAKRYPIIKVGSHSSFPYVHHQWHTNTINEVDLVEAQKIGLTLFQSLSVAVVHVGNIPAECIAKIVGHGQTILCGRPSEVVPHALAIQAYFRASGDRLHDQDQQQIKLDLIKSCVKFLQSPNKDGLTEEPLHFLKVRR